MLMLLILLVVGPVVYYYPAKILWTVLHAVVFRFTKNDDEEWITDLAFFAVTAIGAGITFLILLAHSTPLQPLQPGEIVSWPLAISFYFFAGSAAVIACKLVMSLTGWMFGATLRTIRGE